MTPTARLIYIFAFAAAAAVATFGQSVSDVPLCKAGNEYEKTGMKISFDVDGDGKLETVELLEQKGGSEVLGRYRLGNGEWSYFAPDRLLYSRSDGKAGEIPDDLQTALTGLGLSASKPEKLCGATFFLEIHWSPPQASVATIASTATGLARLAPAVAVAEALAVGPSSPAESPAMPPESPAMPPGLVPESVEFSLQSSVKFDLMVGHKSVVPEDETSPASESCPRDEALSWGLDEMRAAEVWEGGCANPTGKGVRVAILDTRVCPHACYSDRVLWKDAMDNPKDCKETAGVKGHGTLVAGIVGAENRLDGVAPEVSLIPVRVLDDRGCGWASDVVRGIRHAIDNKADVMAAAWVLPEGIPCVMEVLKEAEKGGIEKKGILFVTPAEDQNGTGDSAFRDLDREPVYPAAWRSQLENMIVVGGVNDDCEWFSSWGSNTVDLAAPAYDIRVLGVKGDYNRYHQDGTSLAVAFVAGAAALYLGCHPGTLAKDLRQKLIDSSAKLDSIAGLCNDHRGCGILDVAAAVGVGSTPASGPVGGGTSCVKGH